MNYQIEQITPQAAEKLCRRITADLPEYFGLPECNEHYAHGMLPRLSFAAKAENQYAGLITLEFPYPQNANIYWMSVMRQYQGQGIGSLLIKAAMEYAIKHNAKTITVETLAPTEADENYLKTYRFYEKQGFLPLFNLKPANYEWNMVYMSKSLDSALYDLIMLEKDARKFGFDWPDQQMIIDQAISECKEIEEAIIQHEPDYRVQEEIGDLLHTALSLCIFSGFDTEQTLAKINEKFGVRMSSLKEITKEHGLNDLQEQSIEFMLKLWKEAKKRSR